MKDLEKAQNRAGGWGIWVVGPVLLLTWTMKLPATPLFSVLQELHL